MENARINMKYLAFDRRLIIDGHVKTHYDLYLNETAPKNKKIEIERQAYSNQETKNGIPYLMLANLFVDLFKGLTIHDEYQNVLIHNPPLIQYDWDSKRDIFRLFPLLKYDASRSTDASRLTWFLRKYNRINVWANSLNNKINEDSKNVFATMEQSCERFLRSSDYDPIILNEYLKSRIMVFVDDIHDIEIDALAIRKKAQEKKQQEKTVLKSLLEEYQNDRTSKLFVSTLLLAALRWEHITYNNLKLIFMGADGDRKFSVSDKQYLEYLEEQESSLKFEHLSEAYMDTALNGSIFEKEIRSYYTNSLLKQNDYGAFDTALKLTEKFPQYSAGFYMLAKCYKKGIGCIKSDSAYYSIVKKIAKMSDSSALLVEIENLNNIDNKERCDFDIIRDLCLNILDINNENTTVYGKAAFILASLSDCKSEKIKFYKLSAETGYVPAISQIRELEKAKRVIKETAKKIDNSSINDKIFYTNCYSVNENIFVGFDFEEYNVYSLKNGTKIPYYSIDEFFSDRYNDSESVTKFPKQTIFAFCSEDETQNINDTLFLLDYLYNKTIDISNILERDSENEKRKSKLIESIDIYVSARYDTAAMLIDASLADMGGETYFKVHIYDKYKSTARWLLSSYPLFMSSMNEKEVHMIALGNTHFIHSVIKEAVSCCFMSTCDLKITAVDSEISLIEKSFKQEALGLYTTELKNKITPEFIQLDLFSSALENAVSGELSSDISDKMKKGTYFVIDVGSDFENIRLAKRLRTYLLRYDESFKRFPIIAVRVSDPRNAYLAERLTVGNKEPDNTSWFNNYGFCVFSDCIPSFAKDINLIEKLGLNIHLSYYGNDKTAGRRAYYTYSYNVDSSEAAAVGLIYKFFDSNVILEKTSDYSTMTFEKLKELAKKYNERITQDDNLLNQAASSEQTRFNCYLLVNGWKHANPAQVHTYMTESKSTSHKQELAKLHPFIFDFDDFSEKSSSKFVILKNYLGNSNLRNPIDSTIGSVKNVLEYFKDNGNVKDITDTKEESGLHPEK